MMILFLHKQQVFVLDIVFGHYEYLLYVTYFLSTLYFMATLNLDLSEYDSLRESLKEKDSLISKYEKIIQDLENKSRVIIKTKHIKSNINIEYLISKIRLELNTSQYVSTVPSWVLRTAIHKALLESNDRDNFQNDSTQYIGFDDVEESVRAEFRNKINKELEELERAQKTHKKLIEKT